MKKLYIRGQDVYTEIDEDGVEQCHQTIVTDIRIIFIILYIKLTIFMSYLWLARYYALAVVTILAGFFGLGYFAGLISP